MSCGSKDIKSKLHPVSCNNTHHDVTDLVNHGMVKNKKNWNILRTEHNFLTKQKKSYLVPQMAHFEKLLFSSGGNL